MRLLTHTAALLVGAALAAGTVAIASPSNSATGPNLSKQVAQLQKDDARLKFTVGNLCVWFKHAPSAIQLPTGDQALAYWLYNVGLGCDTFGLH